MECVKSTVLNKLIKKNVFETSKNELLITKKVEKLKL